MIDQHQVERSFTVSTLDDAIDRIRSLIRDLSSKDGTAVVLEMSARWNHPNFRVSVTLDVLESSPDQGEVKQERYFKRFEKKEAR